MNQTQCIAAETSVLDISYNIVRSLHIIFGIIVLILLVKVIVSYKTKSVKLHQNLIQRIIKILISSVFFLNALFAISFIVGSVKNFIVLFTYFDPCDCLTQVWLVYLIRIPAYIYTTGSPLFHFAIMIERIIATIFVKIYEYQGKKIGIVGTIIVWSLMLMFGTYVYLSSIIDIDIISHQMVYLSLTSIYNANVFIVLHYLLLFLVICIAIADYFLIYRNKKIKSNFSVITYSLSQSYQAKQNILVMKIIFPLDFSYTFVFALFNLLSSFIRSKREEDIILNYVKSIDGLSLLLSFHIILTLIVYDYFLKKQNNLNKNFIKMNMNLYSDRLWNS
ncbi:hypothetical protein Mgra_00007271 [Meloidogyne graminicola]|uniref:G_PROTEIN_RECEP_F1_2 domain-containing protein n=1 Tax=Meloidogyne graminicola TaxID=189291 RepID=A0A8S9ZJA6_9BILA|nr:hypothetical protein Mgra_00007271 [Meloidogyne graminicola]